MLVQASDSATKPPVVTADPGRRRAVIAASIATVAFLALDLWTKSWAWHTLRDAPRIAVIKKWFYLDFSFNTGSAFGFLRGHDFSRPLFIAITLATVVYMATLVRKLPTERLYGFVAIGCIIGGALGNLHDRLLRQMLLNGEPKHGVVDFIQVYYAQGSPAWPNFNIADVALVIGVLLLIPFLMFHAEPQPTPASSRA
ncbi:MAG: signal peptidase II [Nannocystis sp.]|uniref:signal peptidase II n=1 Tax=Nannocystis sp. TaxID=1962667 RepID=UPI0024232916|nr:signal peptidase II [Nannocystis sp.]MBK9757283.1 signal peptidase II [Nannocystis sp.]